MNAEYVPPTIIIPQNIKSIGVQPFENKTSQPGIENKLWLAVTQEFINDGRIRYMDDAKKADGVVVGTIIQYVETETSHDQNLIPTEYQIWVVMNLKFLDQTKNQYLWEEPLMEQKFRYFTETQPGGMTREQAREELWSRFAIDIVKRTVEGFGTVTSASPKSIPSQNKTPVPINPPPAYPTTAPY